MKQRWLPLLWAALLAGCGTSSAPPEGCEQLRCPQGTACDPAFGRCAPVNSADGGGEADAGRDAGSDAGPDGGGDAGPPADAGSDGGELADGGQSPCAGGCVAPLFCDLGGNGGSGACVTCTATMGCESPTPVCDTALPGGECVGCTDGSWCFGLSPVCDPSTRTCVGCLSGADCAAPFPVCEPQAQLCVGCLSHSDCGGEQPSCDPASRTCVGCLGDLDCQNPTPVCDLSAQSCGPCTAQAECGAGKECSPGGSCIIALPDTCATAQALAVSPGGTVTFTASTAAAADAEQGSCNLSGGAERVYLLSLALAQDLTFDAQPQAGTLATAVLYLRQAPCKGGQEVGCARAGGPAGAALPLTRQNLGPGDYYLFVEGEGAAGDFEVSVTSSSPSGPGNGECATAAPLTFSGEIASATGTTVNASNSNPSGAATPTCSNSARQSGPDVVYRFSTVQAQDVSLTVTPLAGGSGLAPVVYLRGPEGTSACDSDTERVCEAAVTVMPVSARVGNLPAGTWFAWVDSGLGTSGAFGLEVQLGAPTTHDACTSPKPLSFVGEVAVAEGDTRFATNGNAAGDLSPSCSASARGSGRDLVYSYTLAGTRDVTVSVTPLGQAPTYQPVVYVRDQGSCADPALIHELGCAANPGFLTLPGQPAGTYFLWVDGAQDTAGPFAVEVTQALPPPPPANDSCPGTALAFSGGWAQVSGSTGFATNDNSAFDFVPTCSTSAREHGRDVVYSYSLAQAQDVSLTLTPTSSGYQPVLYVKRGACSSYAISDELACLEAVSSGPLGATLLNQPAGTYWVWVDGAQLTRGDFELEVLLSPATAPPANDGCPGAQLLTFAGEVATAFGDTTIAGNSNQASDASPTCSPTAKQKGRDLVYRYALAGPRDVTVTVSPTGAANPFIPVGYVRGPGTSECTSVSAGSEQGCAGGAVAGPLTFLLYDQPPGDHFLFVDGAHETFGAFDLNLVLAPASVRPEVCATAATLTPGVPRFGDTSSARDDYSRTSSPAYGAACTLANTFPFTGRELVYRFTATSTEHAASLAPALGFDPALLFLRPPPGSSCSPIDCAALSDNPGQGAAESLSLTGLTVGEDYFLVVDAWNGAAAYASGSFTLTVQ